jgi:hypothetical protein
MQAFSVASFVLPNFKVCRIGAALKLHAPLLVVVREEKIY